MSLRNTNLKLVCPISPALFGAQDIPPLFLTGTLWQSHHLTFGEEQRSFPDNREFNSFKRVLCQSATAQLDALIDAAMESQDWVGCQSFAPGPWEKTGTLQFHFISSVLGRKLLFSIPPIGGVDFQVIFIFSNKKEIKNSFLLFLKLLRSRFQICFCLLLFGFSCWSL